MVTIYEALARQNAREPKKDLKQIVEWRTRPRDMWTMMELLSVDAIPAGYEGVGSPVAYLNGFGKHIGAPSNSLGLKADPLYGNSNSLENRARALSAAHLTNGSANPDVGEVVKSVVFETHPYLGFEPPSKVVISTPLEGVIEKIEGAYAQLKEGRHIPRLPEFVKLTSDQLSMSAAEGLAKHAEIRFTERDSVPLYVVQTLNAVEKLYQNRTLRGHDQTLVYAIGF